MIIRIIIRKQRHYNSGHHQRESRSELRSASPSDHSSGRHRVSRTIVRSFPIQLSMHSLILLQVLRRADLDFEQ